MLKPCGRHLWHDLRKVQKAQKAKSSSAGGEEAAHQSIQAPCLLILLEQPAELCFLSVRLAARAAGSNTQFGQVNSLLESDEGPTDTC